MPASFTRRSLAITGRDKFRLWAAAFVFVSLGGPFAVSAADQSKQEREKEAILEAAIREWVKDGKDGQLYCMTFHHDEIPVSFLKRFDDLKVRVESGDQCKGSTDVRGALWKVDEWVVDFVSGSPSLGAISTCGVHVKREADGKWRPTRERGCNIKDFKH